MSSATSALRAVPVDPAGRRGCRLAVHRDVPGRVRRRCSGSRPRTPRSRTWSPKDQLEQANQLSLPTTYGSAPVAAALFSVLALISGTGAVLSAARTTRPTSRCTSTPLTFLVSAVTIFSLARHPEAARRQVSVPVGAQADRARAGGSSARPPLVRGLIIGMLGAFAAGGAVIGIAKVYVQGARRRRRGVRRGVRRGLRRHGRRHVPRAAHPAGASAAAGCSAWRSSRPALAAGADRAHPQPGDRRRC